ncbi:hypothetical protein [Nocardioides sp. LS1]|uniref:hypothetical protein n=1 Tax=Nocardioides sp. LS1 TaxID=1027620 RepID=UPI000F61DBD6|nr:hypothetical protein [Nocardioides sp. LS1]GCD88881.1 hypothetical protein NLS1_08870 [Nocardioides sp. LS1]
MDDVTWGALTLTLTLLGGIWTWIAFRRRGIASGLRAAGFTLLPAAAWLTNTLEMFTKIGSAISFWALHLAFDPSVWIGVVLAGIAATLIVVSGAIRTRQLGGKPAADKHGGKKLRRKSGELPPPSQRGAPVLGDSGDDGMDEIEAILRKRGIS